jgi:hypothetical protein
MVNEDNFSGNSTYSQFKNLKRCISNNYESMSRHFENEETSLRPHSPLKTNQFALNQNRDTINQEIVKNSVYSQGMRLQSPDYVDRSMGLYQTKSGIKRT